MKIVLLASLFFVAIQADTDAPLNIELNNVWETFKTKFNRRYDSKSENHRRKIWENNLKFIQKHNLEHDLGQHSYTVGVNEYSDLTTDEFRTKRRGFIKPNRTSTSLPDLLEDVTNLPASVDWRAKGYVTAVRDQGGCGCCWAISATGALEGQYFKKTGVLVALSEQQLLDCVMSTSRDPCDGGDMISAFEYVRLNGIPAFSNNTYKGIKNTCTQDPKQVVTRCTGFVEIPPGNELSLASAVATVGPISVGIDSTSRGFQLYKSGIFNDPSCSSVYLDHAVLVVGYGTENGKNYWLVKNSWGKGWGIGGYVKMSKDAKNQCGIATSGSYPII